MMRIFDNANPEGRYVDTRDHRTYPAEQAKISARGTRPQCPACGWTMNYVPPLQDSDWRTLNPNSPAWEEETRAAVERRRTIKALIIGSGDSIYECNVCRPGGLRKHYRFAS